MARTPRVHSPQDMTFIDAKRGMLKEKGSHNSEWKTEQRVGTCGLCSKLLVIYGLDFTNEHHDTQSTSLKWNPILDHIVFALVAICFHQVCLGHGRRDWCFTRLSGKGTKRKLRV